MRGRASGHGHWLGPQVQGSDARGPRRLAAHPGAVGQRGSGGGSKTQSQRRRQQTVSAFGWPRLLISLALLTQWVPILRPLFAKGGWQSDRIKRLRLRVARSKRKCVGSIAAHPCKKRKDGAPTFRYGKGKTERGEGWASPQEPTDKGNGRSFTAVPR